MTTFMQKVQDYFARKEDMRKYKKTSWYSRQAMKYMHKKSKRFFKKLKPTVVTRTYPDGTQETFQIKLYKGRFTFPKEYIQEMKGKKIIKLVDGSVVELTNPKQKGTLEVSL